MDTLTKQHLDLLHAMDGFNEAALGSYFEIHPDGQYTADQYMDVEVPGQDQYMAVSPSWLNNQQSLLKKQPWFRAAPYGRREAVDELQAAPVGTFVVRPSSDTGKYAISVKRKNGNVDHMLILPSWGGPDSTAPGQTQYRIGTYSSALFNTVPKLIAYYVVHPYFDDEMLAGIVLPEEQEGGYNYMDVCPVRK
ncbi:hypothetical protein PTSG_09422 [Salpingoeca rosetta]|uniref:SH2 domain-containing protein n=1 Tax=Salpingoeca rosetta (strain ATCC 50818 / BSB-021) TaxID=946362 RepID=F2UMK7_SALR5|nr:uncharacterized protein PTSG_09422 [Salpingoeca rosetta]EGD78356.1 hypothetical protein PTSG_09422 [Salpingoeca rosetta]|eukprot:XP_004989679.1 hypothetical protein PTSG_09422 [Salpingoeca rosetta]